MTIELTPALERALAEAAEKQGSTPQELAVECLSERFLVPAAGQSAPAPPETLYDLIADHIGVLDSSEHIPGGAQMSSKTEPAFAEWFWKQREEDRL